MLYACVCVWGGVCAPTVRHQFDLPADSGHAIPGQTAYSQCIFQMTKHDLALQMIVLVNVRVHCYLCGVGREGHPLRRIVGTTRWGTKEK